MVTTRVEASCESRTASPVHSAEAADVASTEVTSADVTSTDMATAAPGLCRGSREAPGKRRCGQNHHQPFHRILLLACGGSSATN
jgi:hypothetical protein